MKLKNISFLCAASVATLMFSGCSDDIVYDTGNGEGRILLGATLNSDTKVSSRAAQTNDELAANTLIWISNSKGVVRKYNGIGKVPATGIRLVCDNYIAEAWAGDSVPASFDKKYFKGREDFTLRQGETMQVNVECKIANVVLEVNYDEPLHTLFETYSLTAGHKGGELTFEGSEDEGRPGYFMMPSFDKNIAYTMTGVQADGTETTVSGTIENAKPGTKYKLRVKYEPEGGASGEIGAGLFTIEVDETEILVENKFDIVCAPVLTGLNFELDKPQVGESAKWTERKVWIQSTAPLKAVEVDCSTFSSQLGINPKFEIFGMDPAFATLLESKGFTYLHFTHKDSENPEFEEMKLVFGADFLNVIPEGEHPITITVTDENNRTSSAVINVLITNAPIRTEAISDVATIWATKATLTGTVLKDGDSGFGFDYRALGTQQWQHADAAMAATDFPAGSTYSCELTNLNPGTTYEYRAVSASFTETSVLTFTTEAAQQLPNAGFETWTKPAKPWLPYADENDMFWDSGNWGATTLSADASTTTPAEDKKHTGTYSARLETKFSGMGSMGKMAAGNIFVGKYLKTDISSMSGVLGWGRPFASRPKALKGYLHYVPEAVTDVDASAPEEVKQEFQKGSPDKGIIYIAIVDDSKQHFEDSKVDSKYWDWPCIVNTNTKNPSYFKKTDANVIAYGEKVLEGATSGDAMVEFEIPLEYYKDNVKASNIIVVCSASKGGDYFTGARGSVLYIDDFELVY